MLPWVLLTSLLVAVTMHAPSTFALTVMMPLPSAASLTVTMPVAVLAHVRLPLTAGASLLSAFAMSAST